MMAVEKALRWKAHNAFHFPTATTAAKFGSKFHQGLLSREGDETTVQRRVGRPAGDNASLVTERFIRTSTRGSSSRPERFFAKRPDTFTQTRCFAQLQNLLQSGGGPYIVVNWQSVG